MCYNLYIRHLCFVHKLIVFGRQRNVGGVWRLGAIGQLNGGDLKESK